MQSWTTIMVSWCSIACCGLFQTNNAKLEHLGRVVWPKVASFLVMAVEGGCGGRGTQCLFGVGVLVVGAHGWLTLDTG